MSLKPSDKKPTEVVRVVRKHGMATVLSTCSNARDLCGKLSNRPLSRCEKICTVSLSESAIIKGMTMLVTLFRVMPVMPISPRVAPRHTEMLTTASKVRRRFLKNSQVVRAINR